MPSFRWQGQDWELPNIQPDTLPKIRPSLFISYFFAIESNKREPASSSNKHFLTEAYKTVLERKLGLKAGDDEMVKALHRWKEDKYWSVGHGGPGDSFSTRANPNSLLIPNSQTSLKGSGSGQDDSSEVTPEKQLECFFWRRDGECKFSEEDCLYAHHTTGKIKEYSDFKDRGSSFRPYKSTPVPVVKKTECFYWAQNKCRFSAEDCMFAHYRVDDRYSPEGRRRERRYTPERFNHYDNTNNLPSKQLECYFWRRDGECKFSEEDCLYAHHHTGKVKEIPGQAKIIDRETDSRRLSQHTDKMSTEYAMPQPPTMQLSELTLSAFFDLFCYTNPSARRDSPWETVLKMYKTYVLRNFGKDTGKHVLAAYARTKLPIPDDLLKRHTLQLDDELSKKATQEPKSASDKSSDTIRNATTKRPRSSDEAATPVTPKRVKTERQPIATLVGQAIASQPIHQSSKKDGHDLQKQVEKVPVRQSARLYSPSMPYEALPQPKFNDASTYSTRAEQAASVDMRVSSISAEMAAGNAARDLSHNSRPQEISLTGRSSAVVSPILSSATTREGPRTAAMNGKAADTPHVNGVDSRNSKMQTEKNAIPAAVPSTTRTSSPPKTGKPVPPEKVSQGSREGIMHPSPSSRGNDHVAQSSSIVMVIKGNGSSTKEASINGTHHGDTNNAHKYLSNGHGPISHGARLMSDKVSVSGGSEHQTPRLSHSHELAVAGEVNGNDMIPAATSGRASSQIANTFTYQEPSLEPFGAYVVRVEALLRGALMELETLKRAMR